MEAHRALLAVLCFSSLAVPALQECKEEYLKRRPTHTACKPPNRNCIIKKRRISPEERLLIVKTHNDYRSMVALGKLQGFPPAANMARLVWDKELASVAQAKAEQCTSAKGEYSHDDWHDRFTTKFNATGQNLAFRGRNFRFTSSDWPGRIKEWFIEYEDYPSEQRHEFRLPAHSKPMIGHFTQLVWAKTSYVGCGFVEYSIIGAVNLTEMQFYVCNYAVTGNVFRRPLYQEGPACSACPNGTVCDKAFGLCGITAEEQESGTTRKNSGTGEQRSSITNTESTATKMTSIAGKSDSSSIKKETISEGKGSSTTKKSGMNRTESNTINTRTTADKKDSRTTAEEARSEEKRSSTAQKESIVGKHESSATNEGSIAGETITGTNTDKYVLDKETPSISKEESTVNKAESSTEKMGTIVGKHDSETTRQESDSGKEEAITTKMELSTPKMGSATSNSNSETTNKEADFGKSESGPTTGAQTTESKEGQHAAHLKGSSSWTASNVSWQAAFGAATVVLVATLRRYAFVV
ncbi:uncharacterized protein LOC144094393 [Amblyomma americanum]